MSIDLVLVNRGTKNTFNKGPVIDLTFAKSSLAANILWSAADIYTNSDRNAIIFDIKMTNRSRKTKPSNTVQKIGWKIKAQDDETMM